MELSIFHEMGIDTLRMDVPFFDERNHQLIHNAYGIHIEYNAMMTTMVDAILTQEAEHHNISVCHNFYPQKYTGIDLIPFKQMNAHWQAMGVKVGAFVSSQKPHTHGPWPVADGLPSLEDHRQLPLELQVRQMIALGNIDQIMIGNAFASIEELEAVRRIISLLQVEAQPITMGFDIPKSYQERKVKKVLLSIELETESLEIEQEICVNFLNHADSGDGTAYMLRSRMPRMLYAKASIPYREVHQQYFKKGDVVIVNDHLKHYLGELQIVLKDMMTNDQQRNLVGHIPDEELMLLDEIQAGDIFRFMPIN